RRLPAVDLVVHHVEIRALQSPAVRIDHDARCIDLAPDAFADVGEFAQLAVLQFAQLIIPVFWYKLQWKELFVILPY
ncbi:MAG: hypothetical protein RLZZ69_1353, partial [Cyanobacteriota bacterium]